MTCKLLLILSGFFAASCKQGSPASSNSSDNVITLNYEKDNTELPPKDTIGALIYSIDFKVKAMGEDAKEFEDGIIPWISIKDFQKEIDRLMEADIHVLKYPKAAIIIDYPLTNKVTFEISSSNEGFSRKRLIQEIGKKYYEIYEEEEKTATIKTIPEDKRTTIRNRNSTNGKYGIWGHDLSDLVLSSIEVYKNDDGRILLMLGIES